VDFTNLNKACPKDPYPLPRIDQIIDLTARCGLLCFLDAFSGYHQIKMGKEDEEKTVFITPCGVYYYVCMPFVLKNAGATFQRLMRKALGSKWEETLKLTSMTSSSKLATARISWKTWRKHLTTYER
jgi:hypothetical protein